MVVNPIINVITITNYPSSFNIPPAAVWIVPSPWVPVRPRGSPRICSGRTGNSPGKHTAVKSIWVLWMGRFMAIYNIWE